MVSFTRGKNIKCVKKGILAHLPLTWQSALLWTVHGR